MVQKKQIQKKMSRENNEINPNKNEEENDQINPNEIADILQEDSIQTESKYNNSQSQNTYMDTLNYEESNNTDNDNDPNQGNDDDSMENTEESEQNQMKVRKENEFRQKMLLVQQYARNQQF